MCVDMTKGCGARCGILIPENSYHGLASTWNLGLHIYCNVWVVNTLSKVKPSMFSMLFIRNLNPIFATLYNLISSNSKLKFTSTL